jgi:hypothetical protein
MRRTGRLTVWAAVVLLGVPAFVARAERVTEAEARTAAGNYVRLIFARDGAWGESRTARVTNLQPLRRGDRQLAYFCRVEPAGYVVLPVSKDLPPVCAYSVHSNPDPAVDEGLLRLVADRLEGAYLALDQRQPSAASRPARYLASWQALTGDAFDPGAYYGERPARGAGMDYQEGETLLTTRWHQQPPYNDDCPDLNCSWPTYNFYNENAVVGCVSTAVSQILRHWRWPPAGVGGAYADAYDFPNMCDEYKWDSTLVGFEDEHGHPVTDAQIDAVAELNSEVGVSVNMDYGCGTSGAHDDAYLEPALQDHFRYDDACDVQYGNQHSYDDWFLLLKNDINQNRAVEFSGGMPSVHAIAVDGWKEEWVGDDYRMVHAIFGLYNAWDETWFTLDTLLAAPQDREMMVREIFPNCALGATIDGIWIAPEYPYRYFDRDAHATSASFSAGHNLPILRSGFLLSNTGTLPTNRITFYGAPLDTTRFYLYGDPIAESRIQVLDGELRIYAGGQMAIY